MDKDTIPNPGSDEAVDLGCSCPIMDNSYGEGYMEMEGVFVYNVGCSLHGESLREVTDENKEH
jgi:hypothetical protein